MTSGGGEGKKANGDLHIAVKLPFPLTIRFKSMLQSGVATRDLDVRWVSSLSWYFLNLFGLQSVFIFILGDDNGISYSAPLWVSTICLQLFSRKPIGTANGADESRCSGWYVRSRPRPRQDVPSRGRKS